MPAPVGDTGSRHLAIRVLTVMAALLGATTTFAQQAVEAQAPADTVRAQEDIDTAHHDSDNPDEFTHPSEIVDVDDPDGIPPDHVLVEGDIIVPEEFVTGLRGTYASNLWPDGIVPYQFEAGVTQLNQDRTLEAMAEWEAVADVTFVPRTSQANFVNIRNGNNNSSSGGMVGGQQNLNMVSWSFKFIIVHELGHALGLWHEQSRTDRDTFIEVNEENIDPSALFNFDIVASSSHFGDYDFDSVMHYGQCTFVDGCSCPSQCTTITVLPPNEVWQNMIGQRDHLSDGDIGTMAFLYGPRTDCNNNGVEDDLDISVGTSADCNENAVPDECDISSDFESQQLTGLQFGQNQTFTIPSAPMTTGDVRLSFSADADLASLQEFLDVDINGTFVGTVFDFSADDCVPVEDSLIVSAATFNSAVNGGDANITVTPSVQVNFSCNPSSITIAASYPSLEFDCNANGLLDECDGDLVFASHPQSAGACQGGGAQLSLQAVNPGSASYQWLKDGQPIFNGSKYAGVNTSVLSVSDVQPADEGLYSCMVTDGCLSLESDPAPLFIVDPATVTSDPTPMLTRCSGDNASFSVEGGGTGPFDYLWLRDGQDFGGPNSAVLTLNNLTIDDAGSYTCIISNSCGFEETAAGVLEIGDPDFFDNPQSQCVVSGQTAVFTADATAAGAFSIFWEKDGEFVSGASGTTLTIENAQPEDAGDYNAVAFLSTSPFCTSDSDVATLTVDNCGTSDCNSNGVDDAIDIAAGTSDDCNNNAVPDECDVITLGDFDADSDRDLDDYAALEDCLDGPVTPTAPVQPECSAMCISAFDTDGDGDIDLRDYAEFVTLMGT